MDGFWISLPATLGAIGAIITTILSHVKSRRQRDRAKTETNAKLDNASFKLDSIQQVTNGTLEVALRKIQDLEIVVAELRSLIIEKKTPL